MEKRDWPLFVYGGLSSCIAEFSMLIVLIIIPMIFVQKIYIIDCIFIQYNI